MATRKKPLSAEDQAKLDAAYAKANADKASGAAKASPKKKLEATGPGGSDADGSVAPVLPSAPTVRSDARGANQMLGEVAATIRSGTSGQVKRPQTPLHLLAKQVQATYGGTLAGQLATRVLEYDFVGEDDAT